MMDKKLKELVLNEVLKSSDFLGNYQEGDSLLTFLSKIWDLKKMPSEDLRYKDAYGDVYQHMVNNSDWSYEELFVSRLNIIGGDEKYYTDFLELVVNPLVRRDTTEIVSYVTKVNFLLKGSNYVLALSDYFEDKPVYKIRKGNDSSDLPINIAQNKIPIYLNTNNERIKLPHFLLIKNRWDDYGYVTTFDLAYFDENRYRTNVGPLKILNRNVTETASILEPEFLVLDNDFCSLGLSTNYYFTLKKILETNFHSFLLAIKDIATFPKISEKFEHERGYSASLIRGLDAERIVRNMRFEIDKIDPNECYKFNYITRPPYASNEILLNFDFKYDSIFEHRIYALIGKNGTGKTKILSSLVSSLGDKTSTSFSPRKPSYGKVFTVSYSFFDRFDIPASDATFNYVYCGLKKHDGGWKTEEEMLQGFYESANRLKEKSLDNEWVEILSNFLPSQIINYLRFKELVTDDGKKLFIFDATVFNTVKNQLSSGQNIILFIISEILSHIRYDSLIVYDEPETHLHPNAISALMNTLFALVERFESFCIIATHSPIIIQEIPSRNVLVIEKDEDHASVRRLQWESLGENLTVITQDIFGNSEVPKHFVEIIKSLIKKGYKYEQIVELLGSDDLPVTSNVRLYIKTLLK